MDIRLKKRSSKKKFALPQIPFTDRIVCFLHILISSFDCSNAFWYCNLLKHTNEID